MENKLGLSDAKLLHVEKEIVKTKLNLLDEYFVFTDNIFELKFLEQLHNFLFGDLYYEEKLNLRQLSKEEKEKINILFNIIREVCLNEEMSKQKLIEALAILWDLQIFKDGNTRTLLGYLSILNQAFLLNFDIDLNQGPKEIFSELCNNSSVNQK